MTNEFIATEINDSTGIITLNSPRSLNSFGEKMLHELVAQIKDFDNNEQVKVIVIRGIDQSFAAGIDIKELAADISHAKDKIRIMQNDFRIFFSVRKPIISLVSGFALGIGCEIVLCSDIVLATDNARFGLPELSIGLLPCFGGCRLLTSRIGKALASDMILTGRALSAEEAEKSGLVSRIVTKASIMEECTKIVRRISALPQDLVFTVKRLTGNYDIQSDLFLENQLSLNCFDSGDFRQALLTFAAQKP